MMTPTDPLALSRALIRCPSITPEDAGALDVLQAALEPLGFDCHRLTFKEPGAVPVANLWARLGTGDASFCFAGHTDVVPVGDPADWSVDPFAAEIRNGRLWGRGAADMKAAIACFVAAVSRHLSNARGQDGGAISLLITGDEEGPAVNGTVKVLDWLGARGERIAACLVGEPTNPTQLGEMAKIGRRGSLNGTLTVDGVQGHAAYPEFADNPIPTLMRLLQAVDGQAFDDGSHHFQPSRLVITSIDVGNPATNVVPARATARFNVRFNDQHSSETLRAQLEARFRSVAPEARWRLETRASGEPFLSPPGRLAGVLAAAAAEVTGRRPDLSTSGGTSDARFLKDHCPVVEFGMVGETAHKVDEAVALADIEALTAVYTAVLARWFHGGGA